MDHTHPEENGLDVDLSEFAIDQLVDERIKLQEDLFLNSVISVPTSHLSELL